MKKTIVCIISAMLILCALCACGEEQKKDPDFKSVTQSISEKYDFSKLYSVADKEELCLVYGLEENDVSDYFAKYSLTGVDSQEIVLIEAVDDSAADRIKSALDIRYNSKLNEAASYSPEQLELVKKCSVEKNGKIVSLIVDSDAEAIKSVIKGE